MSSLLVTVGADIAELRTRMEEGQGILNRFTEQAHEMALGLAGIFALERLAEFSKGISELAAKAAGVKTAFEEIPHSTALLADMRTTVKGTVDDLDLMKDAVRANNLHIPLQDLGTILEFVHQRALATGGSFTDMAQTVITGIGKGGRGMIGAMSELQISTERYKEAVKETGSVTAAVMKLAQEEIEKSKGKADEFNQTLEQTGATWENTKEKLGEYINKSTFLNELLKNFNNQLTIWASENFTFWQKLSGGAEDYKNMVAALNEEQLKLARDAKNAASFADLYAPKQAIETVKNIAYYEDQIKELKGQAQTLVGKELSDNQKLTAEYEAQLKLLKGQYETARALAQDKADTARLGKSAPPWESTGNLAPSWVGATFSGGINPNVAPTNVDHTDIKYLEALKKITMENTDESNKMSASYAKFGQVAAAAIAGAISGHKSLGDSLLASIPVIITALGSLAIAQITAAATNPESNGGNYYVAAALVAAGVALVGGIFAGLGSSSAGSGGGGVAGPVWEGGKFISDRPSNRMAIDITFQPINGTQLQAVLSNQQRIDNKVTGG